MIWHAEGGGPLDRRVAGAFEPGPLPLPGAQDFQPELRTVGRDIFPLPSFYGGVQLNKQSISRTILRRLQKCDHVMTLVEECVQSLNGL